MTNTLQIDPVAGALGAEISGVELSRDLAGGTIARGPASIRAPRQFALR
jgi:hypothetical protein